MTDTEYRLQMHVLGEELQRVESADPRDPLACKVVYDKINEVNHQWYVSLCFRRRIRIVVCVAVTLFVVYLSYSIWAELSL